MQNNFFTTIGSKNKTTKHLINALLAPVAIVAILGDIPQEAFSADDGLPPVERYQRLQSPLEREERAHEEFERAHEEFKERLKEVGYFGGVVTKFSLPRDAAPAASLAFFVAERYDAIDRMLREDMRKLETIEPVSRIAINVNDLYTSIANIRGRFFDAGTAFTVLQDTDSSDPAIHTNTALAHTAMARMCDGIGDHTAAGQQYSAAGRAQVAAGDRAAAAEAYTAAVGQYGAGWFGRFWNRRLIRQCEAAVQAHSTAP